MAGRHHYSQRSLDRLDDAHPELVTLFREHIGPRFPNTILETARSLEQQEKNVAKGVSKTLDSRHLDEPFSNAVDAAPDPLEWPTLNKVRARIQTLVSEAEDGEAEDVDEILRAIGEYTKDLARWYYFGGYVCGVADELGIGIRWGGDWNGNRAIDDQSFDDLPHFERRPK